MVKEKSKGTQLKYMNIAKAALEAQYLPSADEAENYVTAIMAASKFLRTNDLKVSNKYKKTKGRKFVKLINALEVREALVNKDTQKSEVTFLVEDFEEV